MQAEQANGECFIQTDALDGERNLKSKLALKKTQANFSTYLRNLSLEVDVPAPTRDLYDFQGFLKYADQDGGGKDLGAS